jgi:hypothetical protein
MLPHVPVVLALQYIKMKIHIIEKTTYEERSLWQEVVVAELF